MIYGSVCSGIEAATAAWHPLGWRAAFFSEIEGFPRAVLKCRHPGVPLHGDFTTIQAGDYAAIDLLVGGTPCQSFSVAGLRGGLDDDRGNLALEYLRLAQRLRPRWLVWENVPGVLSSNGGRDFGAILGGLVELGYGFVYRVLDAQHFGVPQRRRRVFVVGYLGDWRRAAAVFLERHSVSGHPAPRRKARSSVAGALAGVSPGGGWRVGADEAAAGQLVANPFRAQSQPSHREDSDTYVPIAYGGNNTRGPIDVACALNASGTASGRQDFESETFVATTLRARDGAKGVDSDCTDTLIAHTLTANGFDASEDGTGRGTPLVPVAFAWQGGGTQTPLGYDPSADTSMTLSSKQTPAITYPILEPGRRSGRSASDKSIGIGIGNDADPMFTLGAERPHGVAFVQNSRSEVRLMDGDGAITGAVAADHGVQQQTYVQQQYGVRRLTPRECERLQGFPDDFTAIEWWRWSEPKAVKRQHRVAVRSSRTWGVAADGSRYKALGNSMAVPVMAWIGRRIQMVDDLVREKQSELVA